MNKTYRGDVGIGVLKGLTFTKCERGNQKYDDYILFVTEHDGSYKMQHHQDCCECVSIEDIVGDLNDLVGSEILVAEERTNFSEHPEDSYTWTFYTLRTNKGSVDIRWYGSSNGYYSEEVSVDRL